MPTKRGSKRRVATAAPGGHQKNKDRKDNGVDISDTSRYYSTYERKSYPEQQSPSCFTIQRGYHQKRKEPATRRDPRI